MVQRRNRCRGRHSDAGNGGTVTQTVNVTIDGQNDVPTVSVSTPQVFTEDPDASNQTLSDNGTVTFDDVDANDLVDVTFSINGQPTWSGGPLDPGRITILSQGFSTGIAGAAAPGSIP